ncbi:hypothetical protein BN2364_4319 [Alloalcanivorax xenomutans]|nr:hypothetical protein BN2364_4319 [Alloalcanivorax xenomutans]
MFLSCLRGSELNDYWKEEFGYFLSCLRGSELLRELIDLHGDFLSCLRGSELEPNESNSLIFKEQG